MSDKALTNAELELTQRMQLHFPRGVIPADILRAWNSCPKEILTAKLDGVFREAPEFDTRLKLIASGVQISGVSAVMVRDCFEIKDGIFIYRDVDFDNLLPETIPAIGLGNASTFELAKELTFGEMVEAHLGIACSLDKLTHLLVEKQKTWSLKQVEGVIRDCERGTNSLELHMDGRPNFFFVEAGGNVFAVNARRYSRSWFVSVYRFGRAVRWSVGGRVLFRNC